MDRLVLDHCKLLDKRSDDGLYYSSIGCTSCVDFGNDRAVRRCRSETTARYQQVRLVDSTAWHSLCDINCVGLDLVIPRL